jgi:diguanylate cyclase (GGDEF)-like protein
MASSSKKSIIGMSSILALVISAHFLSKWSASPSDTSSEVVIAAAITFFNAPILLSYIVFGVLIGLVISVASALVVSWIDLRSGPYLNHVYTLSFIATAWAGYCYHKIMGEQEGLYRLRSEKIHEETILLTNGIEENNRSIASLEEKLRRYSTLKEVIESFSGLLLADDIAKAAVEKAFSTIGKGDRAMLFLTDTERQQLLLASYKGSAIVKEKTGDILDGWVLHHRTSLIVEDIKVDFRFSEEHVKAEEVFRSLIAVPMMDEDKVIGLLRIDSRRELVFAQDDLRLLGIIADLAAVVMQNARLYAKIRDLARTDGLTGLVVRRHFLERFKEEMRRAARKNDPLAFLLMDIDHFKDYNDKYGHTAGDLVLKYLARTINAQVREGDIVVRYGGEEIGVLLYGRDKKEAAQEAERIRREVSKKPFSLRRHEAVITVSIGVASYPVDASLEEELIRVADERLYKAKKLGRNRVCA